MSIRALIVLLFVLTGFTSSHAERRHNHYLNPSDFIGSWHNTKFNETQVVRLEITRLEQDYFKVRVLGLRNGRPDSFGTYEGQLFYAKYGQEREQDQAALMVNVDRGYVNGHVLLRFNRRGEIVSHALLYFRDGRGPIYSVERFAPAENGYGEEAYAPPHRHHYHHRRRAHPPRYSERY